MESTVKDNHTLEGQRTGISNDDLASEASLDNRDHWLEGYMGATCLDYKKLPPILKQIKQDVLDDDHIKAQISDYMSRIPHVEQFCHECCDAFTRWPEVCTGTGAFMRYINTITIEGTARKGCQLCSLIFQAFSRSGSLRILRRIEARVRHETGVNPASLWIEQDDGPDQSPNRISVRPPGRELSKNEHWGEIDYSVVATVDVHDPPLNTLAIARNWLHECQHKHTHCVKSNTADLPTRLVFTSNDGPRLVLAKDWTTTPPYATLSHCWGGAEFLKLKTNNEKAFVQSIPVDQLPKNSRDAIEIIRELGLEYIWIDSLCIIQDDEDDWRKEAARMSIVYGGSHVNVAASAATDPHQGFFPISSRSIDGITVRVKMNGERHVRDTWVQFEHPATHWNAVWSCHLASRAWAFQEKALSPRTIHFGDRGMFWECASKIASESLPGGVWARPQRWRIIQRYRETQNLSH